MKVNFIVDHLGASQLGYYLIKCGNQLANDGYAVTAFYDRMSRHVLRPFFPTMQLVEGWAQDGITVSTSINSTINMIDFPGAKTKLFYVYDLEWVRLQPKIYASLSQLFNHPSITLITRTEEYAGIIENAFNKRPKYIMENFDVDTFKGILKDVTK